LIWNRERVETISPTALDIDRQLMDIESDEGYLINPGSVGQPRDGDPRSAYALYNAEAGVVSYCRVEYDVGSAQRKIRDGGLPPFLAERLSVGR
jgi:diadenosine tetraphosphatase ApaH/serine/threonine PP2A family protein phosphatase